MSHADLQSEARIANERRSNPRPLAPSHSAARLHERLGFSEAFIPPSLNCSRPLHEWRMEENDSPILRYLWRCARPRRHLEFGTWQGRGALDCLESCDATVWTINLREGEADAQGRWAYDAWLDEFEAPEPAHVHDGRDFERIVACVGDEAPRIVGCPPASPSLITRTARNGRTVVRTDALGAIGRLVHEAGLGHRLCQIYCDSRAWDGSNFPAGFFDSALIDGGHAADVVRSDTLNALRLVRSGGLILWHDYCPDVKAQELCPSIRGVVEAMSELAPAIDRCCRDWFWIEPSWLLLGVRNDRALNEAEMGR